MFRSIFKWLLAPLLGLFLGFHIMVAGLLAVGSVVPVTNSAFMMWHRIGGGSVTQSWVDYDNIAKSVKQAAIVSEDAKFATHNGFDFESIQAAMKSNQSDGEISAGGSTISQQLAKNLFLTSHRSYIRKGEEAIITVMMEALWSKQRILEVYLNVAEFGEGIYGIEAAAWHYFKKPASKLNRDQAALLISLLPNPKYYGKRLGAKRLKNKQRIIMRRMNGAILPNAS
ncbi:monofunctional biosynthetic peptidoglycan transglycosylase [Moraxella sp. FZFQ2102]|uniref:monofunctional biosynthetic peptidoglycan transglycosylase n=1 Tax=Moraxella sp. FZFQ2102 TaxID=2953752 RepID=UPI00209C5C81|nr:monofunctional biosynthetic peptidoglycan transglycosylase [Moraxella sp. FZFQ2102]USZ15156.1 monofunctional biosynthetic peptidoglycan transglycosylase [Moraxella sp. FZFQ2102]